MNEYPSTTWVSNLPKSYSILLVPYLLLCSLINPTGSTINLTQMNLFQVCFMKLCSSSFCYLLAVFLTTSSPQKDYLAISVLSRAWKSVNLLCDIVYYRKLYTNESHLSWNLNGLTNKPSTFTTLPSSVYSCTVISCVSKDDYEFVTLTQRHGTTNYGGMQLLWQPCDARQCGARRRCVVFIEGEQMWRFINMHSDSVDSLRRVWWYPSLTRLFSFAPYLHPPSSNLQLPHSLSLIVSRSCIFWFYFLSFLSSFFSCLILLSSSHSSSFPSFIFITACNMPCQESLLIFH